MAYGPTKAEQLQALVSVMQTQEGWKKKVEEMMALPPHMMMPHSMGIGSQNFSAAMDPGHGHPAQQQAMPNSDFFSRTGMKAAIAMRMRIHEGDLMGFEFFECHYAKEKGKVLVFLVTEAGHVIIEDDADLFPSDTLITQLRLLKKPE